eukprot:scaffold110214_cov21-Tisochrysis_lutea.AAC.3
MKQAEIMCIRVVIRVCSIVQVEELAAAHHCFPQLFDASQVLQARDVERGGAATARFHQHMMALGAEEGAAETETFARSRDNGEKAYPTAHGRWGCCEL